MSEVRLSVALSSYNAERYIGHQVASILAQTRLPAQVVVGDAGSTDGTLGLIEEARRRSALAGHDIEWTILDSRRLQLDDNMARIYAACTGDVVVVCDHDDVCLERRFADVAEVFAADPDLLFVHAESEIIDSDGRVTSTSMFETEGFTQPELDLYRTGQAFRVLVRRFLAHGTTSAFRRSLVDDLPPIPAGLHHDAWYALIAAAMGGVSVDERTAVQYRVHASNLSGGVRRRGRVEKLRMLTRPGAQRNARLLQEAEALVAGLDAVRPRVLDWAYELAVERRRHERLRARLPRNRLIRAPRVLREAATGAYDRVGRGRKDVVLDLVQPLG